MDLGIDQHELDACVSCGLCLPHCPTYRVTGGDVESPRGRIGLMRAVQDDSAPVTAEVVAAFDSCIQCRGCETACPSGVPFGHMMEAARETLAGEGRVAPWYLRLGLRALTHHQLVLTGSSLLGVAQRLRLVPSRRLGLPERLPVRRPHLVASGDDVHLFTGCVMDAWQRDTHLAVQRVIEATGAGVRPTGAAAPCCGALHTHAGLGDEARGLARRVIHALDDDRPVLVDSAGCGAALKDYGRLLGTAEAVAFSARVLDVHEWLADHLDELPRVQKLERRVAVQDPCHLRHVQHAHEAVRTVLTPFVAQLVELDDEGMCCGAGGAFSLLQPDLASAVRDRKVASISRAAVDEVASANPGCSLHLTLSGHAVRHPLEIVAEAIFG